MTGPSLGLDPRTHAYRDDVADMALAGKILAHYYAIPKIKSIVVPVADLYKEQAKDAELGSQLFHGERFAVVDMTDGWSWGYGLHDHYVGYLQTEALGDEVDATHIVTAPRLDISGIGELPMGSRITAAQAEGHGDAARPIGETAPDAVAIAEAFLDAPYLWGGRTTAGIDCSGLVQLAWSLAGHDLPRDSDLQLDALTGDIPEGGDLKRGDIIFFPNHVGLMADAETLLHATQHHGKVVTEPLADVIARIAEEHDQVVTGRKRIGS